MLKKSEHKIGIHQHINGCVIYGKNYLLFL